MKPAGRGYSLYFAFIQPVIVWTIELRRKKAFWILACPGFSNQEFRYCLSFTPSRKEAKVRGLTRKPLRLVYLSGFA